MKILLLGSEGQLGWELRRSLAPLGEVLPLSRKSSPFCGDLADAAGLAQTVRQWQPNLIVNAAAYTAVDRAETEREQAQQINAAAVGLLASEAERCGAWLFHYSSDYVFDGSGDRPWRETDEAHPINWYGQTKLEGEQLLMAQCERHVLFRSSWIYSGRGGNFAHTMLRLARERDEMKVVDDQIGAPTGADLIADVTAHVARAVLASPELAGLYHLSAAGETSWLDYARMVLAWAERSGQILRTRADMLQAVPSSAFPAAARRPLNSRLNCSLLSSRFALTLPPWQQGVQRMLVESSLTQDP